MVALEPLPDVVRERAAVFPERWDVDFEVDLVEGVLVEATMPSRVPTSSDTAHGCLPVRPTGTGSG